jgi:hypothetical protein
MPVSTKTPNLTKLHEDAIDQYDANVAADATAAFDRMGSTIIQMIKFYVKCLAVMTAAGLAEQDRLTMSGGTYHGNLSKTDHVLFYKGKRQYPSQGYCTKAFMLKYLHTAPRQEEYKRTNTNSMVERYITWLQVMYGDNAEHTKLTRKPEETIAKFKTTPATAQDKKEGRKFHTAVWIEVTHETPTTIDSAIRTLAREVTDASWAKCEAMSDLWTMSSYDDKDLLSLAKGAMAEYLLRQESAPKAKRRASVTA